MDKAEEDVAVVEEVTVLLKLELTSQMSPVNVKMKSGMHCEKRQE